MIKFMILFVLSFNVFAEETAKVMVLRGDVKFRGQALKQEQIIFGQGEFSLGDKSYLRIQLQKSKTVIALGANTNSSIDLNISNDVEPEVQLFKGVARWVSGQNKKAGGGVRTKNTTMGIRGTDFVAIYNPIFGESELACFDGRIQLANTQNSSDLRMVGKNQWGGLGGRYGKKIAEPISLTEDAVMNLKNLLPIE